MLFVCGWYQVDPALMPLTVGICVWTIRGDAAALHWIEVRHDDRRLGLGRRMIDRAEKLLMEEADRMGVERMRVVISVPEDLYEAQKFFKVHGYAVQAKLPRTKAGNEYLFEKFLDLNEPQEA